MKRSSTDNCESAQPKKQKQMKLFESKSQQNQKFEVSWKFHGDAEKGIRPLMYLTGSSLKGSTKIAAFDMDGCLIEPKSGKRYPQSPTDWKFISAKIPKKLKSLHVEEGFKIVIFTNQAGIEKKKTKESDIQTKIQDMMRALSIPLQAFVSTGENIYRKPCTGSWDYFVKYGNEGVEVDMTESFFVGDAAGRPKAWAPGKKKDHSCSDRKFAANIGLKFRTPEEFFDGAKPYSRFEWGSVNPKTLLSNKTINYEDIASNETEMIIFVGYPASGKSSFAHRYLRPKGYEIVNRDTLKTQEKCEKVALEKLKSNISVVIDNTNPSNEARKTFIEIAKKAGVKNIRCFHFDTPKETAQHLNYYRQAQTLGKVRRIPDVGYNVFTSKYSAPEKSEGFKEVRKIQFAPVFDKKSDKDLFLKWT